MEQNLNQNIIMSNKEKQLTAVGWYIDEIEKYEKGISEYFSITAIQNHARRMQKEQMKKALVSGFLIDSEYLIEEGTVITEEFEQYYNETYGE